VLCSPGQVEQVELTDAFMEKELFGGPLPSTDFAVGDSERWYNAYLLLYERDELPATPRAASPPPVMVTAAAPVTMEDSGPGRQADSPLGLQAALKQAVEVRAWVCLEERAGVTNFVLGDDWCF
jgi:hypothetical protein